MYEPVHFRVEDRAALAAFVRAHALGLLVIARDGRASADAIPFIFEDCEPVGRLRAHVARANPLWRDADGREALVVFRGPDHYVSPSWYPSKAEHGKVVPTWNYAMVQARGLVRVHDSKGWVGGQIDDLTAQHERDFAKPWAVDDAPASYIEGQVAAIVGVEHGFLRFQAAKNSSPRLWRDPNQKVRGASLRAAHTGLVALVRCAQRPAKAGC